MEYPSYYSIIPSHVRYDKDLKPMEIIMYGEIAALANFYGYTMKEDSYFAELYNVDEKIVSLWINSLKERGYIHVDIFRYKDNRIITRVIYINV